MKITIIAKAAAAAKENGKKGGRPRTSYDFSDGETVCKNPKTGNWACSWRDDSIDGEYADLGQIVCDLADGDKKEACELFDLDPEIYGVE